MDDVELTRLLEDRANSTSFLDEEPVELNRSERQTFEIVRALEEIARQCAPTFTLNCARRPSRFQI